MSETVTVWTCLDYCVLRTRNVRLDMLLLTSCPSSRPTTQTMSWGGSTKSSVQTQMEIQHLCQQWKVALVSHVTATVERCSLMHVYCFNSQQRLITQFTEFSGIQRKIRLNGRSLTFLTLRRRSEPPSTCPSSLSMKVRKEPNRHMISPRRPHLHGNVVSFSVTGCK